MRIALVLPLVAGCATAPFVGRQTLVRLFADLRQARRKEPVIIIPGALGSVLEDPATGRVVWGRTGERDMQMLTLPIDGTTLQANRDALVAANLLRRLVVVPGLVEFKVSEDLITILEAAGGYVKGDIEHPHPGDTCFLFSYDWRRDLVESAQQLGAAIDRLTNELGDPNLKVHLIAYSMGGLVARYYIKYGSDDVLNQETLPPPTYAGAKHVAQVIMLGTPNKGSLETFKSLHEGFTVPSMGRFTPATVFTMPAAYQLLPHEDETAFLDGNGAPLAVDLYDPSNWAVFGWSVFRPEQQAELRHRFVEQFGATGEVRYQAYRAQQQQFLSLELTRAKRFHTALDQGNPADEPIEYVLLGSDCRTTLRRAILQQDGTGWRTAFHSASPSLNAKLFGLGDGSVTKESLLGSHRTGVSQTELAFSALHVAYAVFVCESHIRLTQNLTVIDNLLNTLLAHEANAQHQEVCLYCQQQFGTVRSDTASHR